MYACLAALIQAVLMLEIMGPTPTGGDIRTTHGAHFSESMHLQFMHPVQQP